MIVFELVCPQHHRFEGWFASAEDFESQQAKGLLACPSCGDTAVEKLLTAKIGRTEPESRPAPPRTVPGHAHRYPLSQLTPEKLDELINHVLANTEDVGERFAEEARRIYYDEAPNRGIRGVATREETEELLEEGIPVMPLPIPPKKDFH